MRKWLCIVFLVAFLCGPTWVAAQTIPDALRSSSLTQAQENELGRRLAALESRLVGVAGQNQLHEVAVRNIAIEIFGAQPELDFETYVQLIESGARQLREYVTTARQRLDGDPQQAALRARAIAAAEDGRLTEARTLYEDLIAANRNSRRLAREAEDLSDAADISEAARLALVSLDYRGSARLFSDAADLAPAGSRNRWLYRVMQSFAIVGESSLVPGPGGTVSVASADPAAITEAVRILIGSSVDAPSDWRQTIENLSQASGIDLELYLTAAQSQAVSELFAGGFESGVSR